MHNTLPQVFEEISQERPFCERQALFRDHLCQGRSTMEHAIIYAGRQLNEKWSIIRLCYWSHLGPGLNKRINEWIALQHATEADLKKYPKRDWNQMKIKLKVILKIK